MRISFCIQMHAGAAQGGHQQSHSVVPPYKIVIFKYKLYIHVSRDLSYFSYYDVTGEFARLYVSMFAWLKRSKNSPSSSCKSMLHTPRLSTTQKNSFFRMLLAHFTHFAPTYTILCFRVNLCKITRSATLRKYIITYISCKSVVWWVRPPKNDILAILPILHMAFQNTIHIHFSIFICDTTNVDLCTKLIREHYANWMMRVVWLCRLLCKKFPAKSLFPRFGYFPAITLQNSSCYYCINMYVTLY